MNTEDTEPNLNPDNNRRRIVVLQKEGDLNGGVKMHVHLPRIRPEWVSPLFTLLSVLVGVAGFFISVGIYKASQSKDMEILKASCVVLRAEGADRDRTIDTLMVRTAVIGVKLGAILENQKTASVALEKQNDMLMDHMLGYSVPRKKP
jgi:hypothetical protein